MSGNDVTIKLKGDHKDLDDALNDSKNGINEYAKYVKGALVGLAVALSAQQIFSFASDSLAAYQEAEQAELRLQRILVKRGDAIGLNIDQMKDMAAAMQDSFAIEADAVVSAQAAISVFENVNGQQFIDTMTVAANVAAQTGDDFEATAKQIAQSLNDPEKGMRQLRALGVAFTDEQAAQIKTLVDSGQHIEAQTILLERLGEIYGGAASENAKSFASQMNQVSFRIGDMQENIGSLVQELVGAFLPAGIEILDFFLNLTSALAESGEGIGEYAASFNDTIVGAFKWVVEVATDAFSYLEFAWKNYTTYVEKLTYQFVLTFVSAYEEVSHWLTTVIPEYLSWFGDNWANVFIDIANFQNTVIANMLKNIGGFFTSVWDWLNGKEGSFEFVALTEGFEKTMSDLPVIAGRKLTDFEKELKQNIEQYDKQIAQSSVDIFEKNRQTVKKMFEKPEKVKVEPDVKEQPKGKKDDEVKQDQKETAKEVQARAEKAAEPPKNEGPQNIGTTVGIADLAKTIQEAAFKDAGNQVKADAQTLRGPVEQIVQPQDKKAAGDKPKDESIAATLVDLLKLHQELLPRIEKACFMAGGVV